MFFLPCPLFSGTFEGLNYSSMPSWNYNTYNGNGKRIKGLAELTVGDKVVDSW